MRKIFKWIGIVLGSLLGLLILIVAGVLIYSQLTFKRTHNIPLPAITADTSAEGIARGEYLVKNVAACGDCHSDAGNPNYSGRVENIADGPIRATFAVPNLTPDQETGLGSWTDAEIARAIREGVDKDGKELIIMPSRNLHYLSDADVSAVIGYLRSLEPVRHSIPPLSMNAVGKALIAFGMIPRSTSKSVVAAAVENPKPGTLEYGRYMTTIASCNDCHGADFTGGSIPGNSTGPKPPNITGAGMIANWNEQQFVDFFHTGMTPTGTQISDAMPWKVYGKMQNEDLVSIFQYLKSLPAEGTSK